MSEEEKVEELTKSEEANLEEVKEVETPEEENPELETQEPEDEVIVTIGEESPPLEDEKEKAPAWVRELRKSHREAQKQNRELKQQLEALQTPAPTEVKLGNKPKLEDFDYETEEYEQKLADWYEQKRIVDNQTAEIEAQQKAQQEAWQERLDTYAKQKAQLKVRDYDDAEHAVLEMFNQNQQGIIVQGAENSAVVIYALGKNSEKAKELSAITDPVKFAFAVSKLEEKLNVKSRKTAPPPEKTVVGTAPSSGVDSTLERLREEAARTGNYTKINEYKRQKRKT